MTPARASFSAVSSLFFFPVNVSKTFQQGTPAAEGFRMPAEWEPQTAVWYSWPHRHRTWPGNFRPIPAKFAEIIAAVSRYQHVHVNAAKPLQARALALVTKAGGDLSRVTFHDHPTDDAWCRDHGPIFVRNDRTGEVAITDWEFNAWGGKYPAFASDNQIPQRVAEVLGLRRFSPGIVLEGGSIDVNGAGLLLTSEACLLNPNRNPELSREQIEQTLRDYLGVETVLWLGKGVHLDETDGHVDNLCRFVAPGEVVLTWTDDPADPLARVPLARVERDIAEEHRRPALPVVPADLLDIFGRALRR